MKIQSEKKNFSAPNAQSTSRNGNVKFIRDPETGLWKKEDINAGPQKITTLTRKISEQKTNAANLIARSSVTLAQAGIKTPRDDAELLLAFCMNTDLTGLYQLWRDPVTEEVIENFDEAVKRRTQREPLQYITGKVSFYGLDYVIDRRVLIPRPETEILVKKVIELAKSWTEVREKLVFADIGTGSGVISVTCSYFLTFLKVYAVDITEEILDIARINAEKYNFDKSINFLQGNLLEPLLEPVHLLVSNPPYISDSEFEALEPEINKYEPQEALLSGPDGLWHIKNILIQAPEYLLKGGKIILEIGDKQAESVKELVKQYFPFSECEVLKDLAQKDRVVIVHTN